MNFVIHTDQDKRSLYNYLKELEGGYAEQLLLGLYSAAISK